MTVPIPVTINGGFNWTTIFVGLLNLLVGGALVSFIRSRPSLKKIDADREANLLSERAKEMQEMRDRIDRLESALERKEIQHDAERRSDRHKIANLSQCLDALLLLIEQDPQKAAEAAVKVRKMRAEQQAREAQESATIRAAKITGSEV